MKSLHVTECACFDHNPSNHHKLLRSASNKELPVLVEKTDVNFSRQMAGSQDNMKNNSIINLEQTILKDNRKCKNPTI